MSKWGQQIWKIHIRKDNLKFSAAHMTVFPDGSKEGLHGHNYEVGLEVELAEPAFSQMLTYEAFKQVLRPLCNAWDEKVLVASENPWFEALPTIQAEYSFRLCGKRYVLPVEEVVVLNIDNITVENLARIFFEQFWEKLTEEQTICWRERIKAVSLRIDESRGQGASYSVRFGPDCH